MSAAEKSTNASEWAARSYLEALCARRDARRLLDIGFDAAVRGAKKALAAEPSTLSEAVALVVVKEAADLLELYEMEPDKFPEGRTAEGALKASKQNAGQRYRRGRCGLCKGTALDCAVREADR